MSKFTGLYKIRGYRPADKSFIMSTFLKGLYYGDSWWSQIDQTAFFKNYKLVAEALLSSPKTAVKVACLPEDEDVILGYSILSADNTTVHWVFVKNSKLSDGSSWRGKGIGASLCPENPNIITHLTELGRIIKNKKFPKAKFDPFI